MCIRADRKDDKCPGTCIYRDQMYETEKTGHNHAPDNKLADDLKFKEELYKAVTAPGKVDIKAVYDNLKCK